MTSKQKQFILKKLIPFVLREQGRGFCMEVWRKSFNSRSLISFDGIDRRIPSCGSVCCIGGSIEVLKRKKELGFEETGKLIGLNFSQSFKLFTERIEWPEKYETQWNAAKTALAKAKVAAALLREVVRTDGMVLD